MAEANVVFANYDYATVRVWEAYEATRAAIAAVDAANAAYAAAATVIRVAFAADEAALA